MGEQGGVEVKERGDCGSTHLVHLVHDIYIYIHFHIVLLSCASILFLS